jgi:putative Holliday junction resolvase
MSVVAHAPAATSHSSFLAFDFGTRRIGVASGNTLTGNAEPIRSVDAGPGALDAIGKVVAEWQPDALVVGVPRHPDGAAHANTRRARRFAGELRGRFGLDVHEVDERYSTTEARTASRGDLDATAAAVILMQFLRERSAPEAR